MISRCFPQPTTGVVAGVAVPLSGLRLRDLAALEAWVAAVSPRPDAGLDPAAPDYPARLRAAYDAAVDWPPALDSPEGTDLVFGTPEGRAVLLGLALRAVPGLAASDVRELAENMTEPEFAAVCRAAFGRDPSPFAEVTALVDHAAGVAAFTPREDGSPVAWAKALAEECQDDPTRLEAIGDLTLGQWRVLRSGGEPWRRLDPLPEGAEETVRIQALRAAWWADGSATFHPVAEAARDPGQDAHHQGDQGQVGQPPG